MKVKYETRQEDLGIARKRASVYVPYNYSTLTSSSMSDNGVLFQGANAEYKFTWKVEPRENDKLSDFEYATVTPPNTEVKMVEFLYHPDNKKVEGNKFTKDDPATFFKKKGAIVTNSKTISPIMAEKSKVLPPIGTFTLNILRYGSEIFLIILKKAELLKGSIQDPKTFKTIMVS